MLIFEPPFNICQQDLAFTSHLLSQTAHGRRSLQPNTTAKQKWAQAIYVRHILYDDDKTIFMLLQIDVVINV